MLSDHDEYLNCFTSLEKSLIFKSLEKQQLKTVLNDMVLKKWEAGYFKNSIEDTSNFNFIVSGRLKIYQINSKTGREYTIFILSSGDVFDIINLLDSEPHQVYWEAMDDLMILSISITKMRDFVLKYDQLNLSIFKYLAQRMRMLENAVTDVCFHNTLTRLSNLLLSNINEDSKKLEIINNLPNEEIAKLIGTTRTVVNRHIQELKKAGVISVKRKQIDIENLQLLISIAERKYVLQS
jgi:CRP/FNR family transcriptional regulator, cyclic AMP receptor protein